MKSSRALASSQTPWLDICVTSMSEVESPRVDELIPVCLHNFPDSSQLRGGKPVISYQFHRGFKPVFRFTRRTMDMNMHALLFA